MMIGLILALAAFQLTLLLLPMLSIRPLAYSALLVVGGGFLYEAIMSAQMQAESIPIRLDVVFLIPFAISYFIYAAIGFLHWFAHGRIRASLAKGILFVGDCIITAVTVWVFV